MEFLPGVRSVLNWHPIFVHFPIVLILLALLSEIIHKVLKKQVYGEMTGVLLNLAALSAIIAIVTGYGAADSLGHDAPGHDYVHGHRDLMVWFAGFTLLAALAFQFIKSLCIGIYRLVALVILSGMLMVGADRGARLVYMYGMGVNKTMSMSGEEDDHDALGITGEESGEHSDDDHDD